VVGSVAGHPKADWPVTPGTVLAGFDASATTYAPGHRGVDLAAHPGQLVRSSLAGTVTVAGPVAGRSVIVVEHDDGLRTTYLPVQPSVGVGHVVRRGGSIGKLLAGPHCGSVSCLHWGARTQGGYVDPLGLLGHGAGRVVLLPLLGEGRD
jgi:murein DD-endopeptidase MepM/ murein hydrolase activator NlpD